MCKHRKNGARGENRTKERKKDFSYPLCQKLGLFTHTHTHTGGKDPNLIQKLVWIKLTLWKLEQHSFSDCKGKPDTWWLCVSDSATAASLQTRRHQAPLSIQASMTECLRVYIQQRKKWCLFLPLCRVCVCVFQGSAWVHIPTQCLWKKCRQRNTFWPFSQLPTITWGALKIINSLFWTKCSMGTVGDEWEKSGDSFFCFIAKLG